MYLFHITEEPEENLPTKSEAGTDPLEPADQDPSNTEPDPDSGQSEKEGPSKVDAGTDPPEEEEAGPSQAKMEEPAARKTPDLSKRGSRSLIQTEDEVDTSKMKNFGRFIVSAACLHFNSECFVRFKRRL